MKIKSASRPAAGRAAGDPAPLETPRHPIQVVSQRTGIPAELLRVWEKRYRAVTPARTGTSRRLYSDADIERLRLLRRATEGGRRIGDVASLPEEQLRVMVREDDEGRVARRPARGPGIASRANAEAHQGTFREQALAAMDALDPRGIRSALERAYFALGGPAMIETVMAPLLHEIGDRWRRGELDPAMEHMATAVARNALTGMLRATGGDETGAAGGGRTIVIATPTGERHELGAMMAAVVAADAGWGVAYLGADLPVEDMASVAVRIGARAVALSAVYVPGEKALAADLIRLRGLLPPGVAILLGGRGGIAVNQALRGHDVRILSGAGELADALRELESGSGQPRA